MLVLLVASAWERLSTEFGAFASVFALFLAVVPFFLALWLTSTCTAWNGTKAGRCKNRRYGVNRCKQPGHGRLTQLITLPEIVALLLLVLSVVNVVIIARVIL